MPQPEVWLRGPLPTVPPLLQPVAHALLQAVEEVKALMQDLPADLLWQQPAGCASPGLHLQHLKGVLNRLLTYARGEALTTEQLAYLKAEGSPAITSPAELVAALEREVEKSLQYLTTVDEASLTQPRVVGRAGLPSTVGGLLFHAAEHTMRHTGQLLVTVKVLKAITPTPPPAAAAPPVA